MMSSATGPGDAPSMATIQSMSGLDFMRSMLEGRFPQASIAETMGYSLHSVEAGRVVFRGAPQWSHCNPLGQVHGGWYGTLLDSAMACAVQTAVPKGAVYTTLEYKINITRALPVGLEIDCIGLIDHAGRRTGVAHGEIRGVEDGKLYATGSTTCIIFAAPAGA
jgi:uncharacterized protein (TIGR00369 family)